MELVVFTSQQRNEMSFYMSNVLPLIGLLLSQACECFIEAADCCRFYPIPKISNLFDKLLVEADLVESSIKLLLDSFRIGLNTFRLDLFSGFIYLFLFFLLFLVLFR